MGPRNGRFTRMCVCVCVCVCLCVCVCVVGQNVRSGDRSALLTSIPGSFLHPGSVFRGPSRNMLKRLVKVQGTIWQSFGKWPLSTGFMLFVFSSSKRTTISSATSSTMVAPGGTKVIVTYKEFKNIHFCCGHQYTKCGAINCLKRNVLSVIKEL